MRAKVPLIVLLTFAFLASIPCLSIGYLSDDWLILSWVSRHGNAAAWTSSWLELDIIRVHRPVFTALYDLEYRLFGIDPVIAHLHHLLWHVLSVGLLFVLLRQLGLRTPAAWLGAALYAVHPQLAGNQGWLAARAGIVCAAFTLLTLVVWNRADRGSGRGLAWRALAVLAAAVAALTRENGYLALMGPLVLDVLWRRPRPSVSVLVRRHVPFAVAGALLLALRYHALGTLGGGYKFAGGLLRGPDYVADTIREAGWAVVQLAGALPFQFLEDRTWPLIVVASVTGGLAVLGLVVGQGSKARGRAALLCLGLFIFQFALLTVVDPTIAPATGHRWVAATALWCGLLAAAFEPLLRRRWIWFPLLLLGPYLYGHVLVQREHAKGNHFAQEILAKVRREIDTPPLRKGPAFVVNIPASHLGLPTCQWGFSEALGPPFYPSPPRIPVYPVLQEIALGPGFAYPYHAPVEALWYGRGEDPLILTTPALTSDPEAFVRVFIGDDREPDGRWRRKPAQQLEAEVRTLFHATPLRVLKPMPVNAWPDEPKELWFTLDTRGLTAVEVFCYLPNVSVRVHVPAAAGAGETAVDLWPVIRDYVRFPATRPRLFVVLVGYDPDSPARPRLGPLVTFE
jgi:hypothetical protein